jgi:hypothetical protein
VHGMNSNLTNNAKILINPSINPRVDDVRRSSIRQVD